VRWAVAIGVIAITVAAAVYVHQRQVPTFQQVAEACRDSAGNIAEQNPAACFGLDETLVPAHRETTGARHPTWEDPVAVLLAIGGVAVAVGIITTGRAA
jgi:hypothetical protein